MDTNAKGPVVVALGGNAISPPGEGDGIERQFEYMRNTAARLVDLVESGRALVVTHGNGPQVGSALRRVELALREVYPLPLNVCVADTQGGMGYMIAQCVNNELGRRGIPRRATAIVTTVVVDRDDPEFQKPTKPIGRAYRRERAEQFKKDLGWQMVRIPRQGYRRVVPSPPPQEIVEIDVIRRLANQGELLIAGGGGGVPVIRAHDGELVGVEAVIDKDRTSAVLAAEIGAATLVIVTNVQRVALDFGTPYERQIDRLTVAEARMHLTADQFPPGSMGPKIEAAIDFLDRSQRDDARVIICDRDHMAEALAGGSGTAILRGQDDSRIE